MQVHTSPRRGRVPRLAAAVAVLATALAGCAGQTAPAEPAPADPGAPIASTLRIVGGSSAFVPLWIADEQGFLRERGLTMDFEQILQGATVIETVSSNQADAASSTWVTAISAASAAPGPKIVMSTSVGFPVSLRLRPDVAARYGLSADSPFSDLSGLRGSGLRVGTGNIGDALYVWLTAIARDAGLTVGPEATNDLVLVPSSPGPPQIALWSQGDVDALFVPDEFVASAGLSENVALPLGRTAPAFEGAGGGALVVSEDLVENDPGAVQALVTAAHQGIVWAVDPANKAAVLRVFESRLAMSAEGAESFYEGYVAATAAGAEICMPDSQFQKALALANVGRPAPVAVPESDVVDRRFCEAAAGASR